MMYIGLDVGGTTFKAGVVNDKGEILCKDAYPTMIELPYQQIIENMAKLCRKVAADAGVDMCDIAAIGVGVPGICDQKTGIIPFCTNLGWHDIPFVEEMHKHIDLPVYVDNDATVAGLAESVAGVSAGSESSVFLTLGTGVGGGIVINGRPYSGAHGIGSEIGHMILRLDGEPCTCGNHGCFERYASATAIIREARKAVAEHPESAILAKCGGDPRAELIAMMKYMVNHNTAHANELAGLAKQLQALGDNTAFEQVMAAVSDFEKGNMRLSAVLAAMNIPQ